MIRRAYVGDLHGSIGTFRIIKRRFEVGEFDKLVLVGDYCDTHHKSDPKFGTEVLESVIELKKEHGDMVVLILGNHDLQYLNDISWRCSGYEEGYAEEVKELISSNNEMFCIAHLEGNILATHAGVTTRWFELYYKYLNYWAKFNHSKLDPYKNIDQVLNRIWRSHDSWILNTACRKRGGVSYGSPIWADISEIEKYGIIKGYHQVVGHNPVDRVATETIYGEKITYVDCLKVNIQYYVTNDGPKKEENIQDDS